ncbi:nucleotidyltransferase domain-containing protein [Actinopolymorpha sp. B11F2]|uniref:nucleotidyltransferase domain-containing protein n=1 Tax=Actinopolymorpha sp. B11F2 TaxID=3160862 RepID=UPI0032E3B133
MAEQPTTGHADVFALAREHARALVDVDGVVGVMVGGSHARGTADGGSDLDLGVYYREPLDLDTLRALASETVGRPTEVAGPGGWGPWVNGGAWLDLKSGRVDWILRDLDRVHREWKRAQRGEFGLHHQPGHPFGFVSTTYVGEMAFGIVVADPSGELERLKAAAVLYPSPLRAAFVNWLWEAGFSLDIAHKPAGRGDAAYVGMCLAHAVGIMAHALHAHDGRWVVNEKGLVDSAGRLPSAPTNFAKRAHGLCAGGTDPADLLARLDSAAVLLDDVRAGVRR